MKRKLVSIILLVYMVVGLVGCGSKTSYDTERSTEKNITSMDCSFTFDGKSYTLGESTLGEFLNNTGYIIGKHSDYKRGDIVQMRESCFLMLYESENDIEAVSVNVRNEGKSNSEIDNCIINSFSYNIHDASDKTSFKSLAIAGLNIGEVVGDVEEVFGTPKSLIKSDYLNTYMYVFPVDSETKLILNIVTDESNIITELRCMLDSVY